jgi:hypothetical protein
MLRSQRILITVGLLFLAWVLHVNLCDWGWKMPLQYSWDGNINRIVQWPIVSWTIEEATTTARQGRTLHTGLMTQARVELADAVVFGIVVPSAMILSLIYLWLGWRSHARRARGLCEKCGYDLRGAPATNAPCSECGTIQAHVPVGHEPQG